MKVHPLSILFRAIDGVSAPLKTIRGAVGNFQNQLEKTKKNFNIGMDKSAKIGMAANAVGQLRDQALGVISPALKIGMEFEAAMSKVRANSGATQEELNLLTITARKLGSETSFSASQAAEGMNELSKAGLKTNEIIAASPGLLSLAKAGGLDLAEATTIAADTMAQFGLKAENMGEIADVLATAANASTIGVRELGESFKYTAAYAKTAGLDMKQTASLTAILGAAGLKGSVAGTSLASVIRHLANPAEKAQKQLRKFNIETTKMKDGKKVIRDYPDLIKEIAVKTRDLGNADLLGFISDVFGNDASVASAVSALTKMPPEKFNEMFDKIEKDSTGNAKKIGDIMGGNLKGSMTEFNSAMEEVSLVIYDVLLPALKPLAEWLKKAAKWVGDFAKENPTLTKTIIGVVGAVALFATVLAPILLLASGIGSAIATMSAIFGTLSAAVGLITPIIAAFNAVLLANPIGAVIVGIMALVAAIYLLYTYWEEVVAVWNMVVDGWSNLPGWVQGIITVLMPFIGIPLLIAEHWDTIKTFFIGLWQWASGFFMEWYPEILSILIPFIGIPLLIFKHFGVLKDFFSALWDGIISKFTGAVQKISGIVESVKGIFGGGSKTIDIKTGAGGAPLPVGSQVAGGVTNTNTSRNVIDVNFGNTPRGTRITQAKPAKNVNVSMGYNMVAQ